MIEELSETVISFQRGKNSRSLLMLQNACPGRLVFA